MPPPPAGEPAGPWPSIFPAQALLSGADPANVDAGIFTDSSGDGKAGPLTLTAGSLQVLGGAAISAQAFSFGRAGDINLSVSGLAALSGADPSNSPSSVIANSAGSGAAGSITLASAALQVQAGAQLSSSTFASGAGGNVNVNVSEQTLLSGVGPSKGPSGIFASSSTGSGAAG